MSASRASIAAAAATDEIRTSSGVGSTDGRVVEGLGEHGRCSSPAAGSGRPAIAAARISGSECSAIPRVGYVAK